MSYTKRIIDNKEINKNTLQEKIQKLEQRIIQIENELKRKDPPR
jgi:polyhydroxyalkanoate synthesis regulator phasin